MAQTLLRLTQNILSDMDSDEVNSIYDTEEALQVASIIIDTLESEFNNIDLPSFNRILQLESVSNTARPNYLRFQADVNSISILRYRDYRNHNRYRELIYLSPTDFFNRQLLFTLGTNTRSIVDESGVTYRIQDNRAPTYYTSLDNRTIIFDAFDSAYEDSMQATNVFALGSVNLGAVELSDDFVPPIPDNLFPLLKAEAKATAFLTLKQMPNPKAEQVARRQRSRMQNNLYKAGKANNPYARSKFNFARTR